MRKKRIGLIISTVFVFVIFVANVVVSCQKTYEAKDVPSSVTWSENIIDQIDAIRQSENNIEFRKSLEKNNFPVRVSLLIPKKARELDLQWVDSLEYVFFTVFSFNSKKNITLLNETTGKEYNVKARGYEPGFIIEYGSKKHYYFLESFTRIISAKSLQLLFMRNYKQEDNEDKLVYSHEFKEKFYPCLIYDDIDYWIDFAKKHDISLYGRFAFSDFDWDYISYDKAQFYLDAGYNIILDLPENSTYEKFKSGKKFIKTPKEKMVLKFR
ncbi:hypothetical protein K9M50_01355 [Patescibacteria group bacterium]|nr:hypothetical protein [Patescibacteria group bacterium]